jgi:hypothetical protein
MAAPVSFSRWLGGSYSFSCKVLDLGHIPAQFNVTAAQADDRTNLDVAL